MTGRGGFVGALVSASITHFALAAHAQPLPTPLFHHVHLNSVSPEAAADFYVTQFPSTSKTTFAGLSAVRSPNNVLLLFTQVAAPPRAEPPSALWHFGWHVTDVRKSYQRFIQNGVSRLPLYTGDGDSTVYISSDTWQGRNAFGALTKAEIEAVKAAGARPSGGPGFAYVRGPDGAIVEYQGNMPVERFNHIHMFQDHPFCAQRWYQTHLNVPARRGGTAPAPESDCRVALGPENTWPALVIEGLNRAPVVNSTTFGDVALYWFMNQHGSAAASTRGQVVDHFALSVTDLDAWLAKLHDENVDILDGPYLLGEHRAIMIEGPSREAIELVELSARRTSTAGE
jgi:catechol 2,3-dioxygenase-like lactoylglutathione lyase family enzyme